MQTNFIIGWNKKTQEMTRYWGKKEPGWVVKPSDDSSGEVRMMCS